jgi:hypothetical protein
MKCDECLPLIDEFFDNELDQSEAQSVGAHISRCRACRAVLDELEIENGFYLSTRGDLKLPPATWAGIEGRIAGERTSQRAKGTLWVRVLSRLTPLRLPGPLLAGTAVVMSLLFLGAGAFLLRRNVQPQPLVARRIDSPAMPVASPSQAIPGTAPIKPEIKGGSGSNDSPAETTAVERTAGSDKAPNYLQREYRAGRAEGIQRVRRSAQQVRAEDYEITIDPARLEATEQESVHHIEQVQNLLRSFRNSKIEGNAAELRYERKRSRDLLSQNIFLRRNAEESGNVATAELLSMMEPYLLDIANLAEKPTSADVSNIKNRIQKEEVVAALQVP